MAELNEPLTHLVVIVHERAVRAGGHVDAVKQIESPPDDFIVDRGGAWTSVPLSGPPICLFTGARTGQQASKPGIDLLRGEEEVPWTS
jgi:hypothetical protein